MIAAWYDRQGPAAEVLQVGELPTAEPGRGEVRVRLTLSGASPGDMKKRQGWLESQMAFPRIIPHSDGAGVIEAVGQGADQGRAGGRVWVYGAQSYRAFGTAAQTTVVPEALAVDLPDAVSDEMGACFGIPGITAHRAIFADGPVRGQTVLVHGVRGSVSSLAAQLARWAGAAVIGTVRTDAEAALVDRATADHVVSLQSDPASAILRLAPDGVDRVVDVALSANVDLDAAVVRNGAVVAAYASLEDRPELPFWPMLFNNVTIRLLGSDDFPRAAKDAAARDLTDAAARSALSIKVAEVFPLERIAAAHELIESGRAPGRILVSLPLLVVGSDGGACHRTGGGVPSAVAARVMSQPQASQAWWKADRTNSRAAACGSEADRTSSQSRMYSPSAGSQCAAAGNRDSPAKPGTAGWAYA